ncbi:MAG: hypothetical protein KC448_07390 [Yoonia sp.]|nr:hypothetical protein [Yoonia sp.]
MSEVVVRIWRQIVLSLTVVVAVIAFLPDVAHLGAQDVAHEMMAADHDHENRAEEGSGHCHSGASCTGAMTVKNWLIASRVGLALPQLRFALVVNGDSHTLGSDPPVPIVTV